MAIQLKGNSGTNVEVDAATRAVRVTQRPIDYGTLGSYSLGATSGVMTAGLGGASAVFAMRWTHATNIALIRRVAISAGGITVFTAGTVLFDMLAERSWTVGPSAQTAVVPVNNDCKRRTAMGTSLFAANDVRVSNTGAITVGTATADAQPLAAIMGSTTATAGTPLIAPGSDLWTYAPGDGRYPLYLATNEGFIVRATVPGSGTWGFSVSVDWDELLSASYF